MQKGLKLFADRSVWAKNQYDVNAPTREELQHQFKAFKESLPTDVLADIESEQVSPNCFYTFVCRAGTIADHIDLGTVFEFYEKLGQNISAAEKREIERLCGLENQAVWNRSSTLPIYMRRYQNGAHHNGTSSGLSH